MANGRVITGYSKPYVAKYNVTGGNVTYSNGMPLARGVDVNVEANTTDDNKFYADNIVAENEAGKFTSGTLTLNVDGLKDEADNLISGLTASEGYTDYDDDQTIPYMGVGYIIRYQEDGVETFVPFILPKVMFNDHGDAAETQGEQKNWQTQELTAQIYRDDTAKHKWKRRYTAEATEAAAEAKIKTFLNITGE